MHVLLKNKMSAVHWVFVSNSHHNAKSSSSAVVTDFAKQSTVVRGENPAGTWPGMNCEATTEPAAVCVSVCVPSQTLKSLSLSIYLKRFRYFLWLILNVQIHNRVRSTFPVCNLCINRAPVVLTVSSPTGTESMDRNDLQKCSSGHSSRRLM